MTGEEMYDQALAEAIDAGQSMPGNRAFFAGLETGLRLMLAYPGQGDQLVAYIDESRAALGPSINAPAHSAAHIAGVECDGVGGVARNFGGHR